MLYALVLFAQAAEKAAEKAPADGAGGIFGNPIWLFLIIGVMFWFMLIRPAQRQERERKAMIAAIKKNDRVVAAGGIIGTIVTIKDNDDVITLRVDDNARIQVLRSSIARVIREKEEEPSKEEAKPN